MITGCINGRFQPFHNGHLEYMQAAARSCERLIIGITQYDQEFADEGSPAHRMNKSDNPFTYWERYCIIRAVVAQAGMSGVGVEIVPFPIHVPETIVNFVGRECIMYTTIYDAWNVKKIRRLREQQYEVRILWRRRFKEFEGKAVRAAMRADMTRFKSLVPAGSFAEVSKILTHKAR